MNTATYTYIDLQTIKEDTFGDVPILKMVMALFIEGIEEYTKVLIEEFKNKNWQLLFQATHKIKPNIFMFGISKLESTILQLDNNFRNEENLENVEMLISTCLVIFKEVKTELQTELKLMNNE